MILILVSLLFCCVQIAREIPLTESLKDTAARSSVYWNEVLAPALQEGKTLLVVGHENNLRSILMALEDIPPKDIINLSLPRAVPLAYRLDENLKPLDRPDGKLDEATGFLRGEWIGGDEAVKKILERDHKQVYDTSIKENLELKYPHDQWTSLMEFLLGKSSPYHKALGEKTSLLGEDGILTNLWGSRNAETESPHSMPSSSQKEDSFANTDPVPAHDRDPLEDFRLHSNKAQAA